MQTSPKKYVKVFSVIFQVIKNPGTIHPAEPQWGSIKPSLGEVAARYSPIKNISFKLCFHNDIKSEKSIF